MRALAVLAFALCMQGGPAVAQVLVTPQWRIALQGCEEGVVSCDDVKFDGTDKATGKRLKMTGRTLHTLAADGVTPSRFLGYEFRRGSTVYSITDDGELVIRRGGRTVRREQGAWED